MHTHTRTYDIIGNSQGFPNGGGHLHEIIMFNMCACVCVRVHACACVCTCVGGTPNHPWPPCIHPPPPSIHPPTPRPAGSPKHQNSISLELIEIIRFCLKILYLWTFLNSYRLLLITPNTRHPPAPPPRAEKTQIGRITITLERIKLIQFCLKICDPWTLLHTYRLGLMYRWGGCPIPNGTFMFWTPKSTSFSLLWASDKNFSCFCTGSH